MDYVVEFTALVDVIKFIARAQTPVQTATDGDVYENWNSSEIRFGGFNVALEQVSYDNQLTTYRFVMYYGDRLMQDKSNVNSVIEDGVRVIQTVLNNVTNINGVEVIFPVNYIPFEQKFMDYLAGVYVTVDIQTESVLGACADLLSPEWRLGMPLPGKISPEDLLQTGD